MTRVRTFMLSLLSCIAPLLPGQSWEYYDSLNSDLPGNQVNTLFIDAYGGKWFGTMGGLAHFTNGSWNIYTREDGLAADSIVHLNGSMEDGVARLYVSTPGGVSELSYDNTGLLGLESYNAGNSGLTSDSVSCIIRDTGGIYYGSPVGLDIRHEDRWTFADQVTTSEEVVSLQQITCIAMTPHGWSFLGTRDHGVARIHCDVDGVSGASSYSTEWSGLLTDRINDIHITDEGDQWYATDKGVAHHQGYETKKNWRTYTEYSSGLISNLVHAVAHDAKGITWAGTDKGIARFDGLNWFSIQDMGQSDSYAVFDLDFDADGSIWFASDKGIIHLDEMGNTALEGAGPSSGGLNLTSFTDPAGDKIIFRIEVPTPRQVSIFILDLNGRVLQKLCDHRTVTGTQNFTWNIQGRHTHLPQGIYIALVQTEKEYLSKKILITPRGSNRY